MPICQGQHSVPYSVTKETLPLAQQTEEASELSSSGVLVEHSRVLGSSSALTACSILQRLKDMHCAVVTVVFMHNIGSSSSVVFWAQLPTVVLLPDSKTALVPPQVPVRFTAAHVGNLVAILPPSLSHVSVIIRLLLFSRHGSSATAQPTWNNVMLK